MKQTLLELYELVTKFAISEHWKLVDKKACCTWKRRNTHMPIPRVY